MPFNTETAKAAGKKVKEAFKSIRLQTLKKKLKFFMKVFWII